MWPFSWWDTIRARILGAVVVDLSVHIVQNVVNGLEKFDDNYYPMPVRCRARHWMGRGEARIDFSGLLPEDSGDED